MTKYVYHFESELNKAKKDGYLSDMELFFENGGDAHFFSFYYPNIMTNPEQYFNSFPFNSGGNSFWWKKVRLTHCNLTDQEKEKLCKTREWSTIYVELTFQFDDNPDLHYVHWYLFWDLIRSFHSSS